MPVTFEQDKNGRISPRGSITTAPPSAAAASPAKPKPPKPQKSWWQSTLNNLQYERKRLTENPGKRLGELTKPIRRIDPKNDVQYELKQLSNPKTAIPRLGTYLQNAPTTLAAPGLSYGVSKATPYGTSAVTDALKGGIEVYQRIRKPSEKADYNRNPLGSQLDRVEERSYTSRGLKPRQEQEGAERFVTDAAVETITSVAALAVGGGLLARLAARGGVAGAVGRRALAMGNPAAATTAVGAVARGAVANVAQEVATVPFVDNSGNFFTLVNTLTGTAILPDSYRPDMDRVEAMGAALVPSAVAGVALPAALGGAFKGAQASTGLFRAIARSKRNVAEVAPLKQARQKLEKAGLMEKDPESGAYRRPAIPQEEPKSPAAPPSWADAEKEFANKYGFGKEDLAATEPADGPAAPAAPEVDQPGALATRESLEVKPPATAEATPRTEPAGEYDMEVDPWEAPPEAVEADVLLGQLEELDNADRVAIYANPDGPVAQAIDQVLSQRGSRPVNTELTWDRTSVPRESVAEDYLSRYGQKLRGGSEEVNFDSLRDVVVNTPELAAKATAMFGKPVTQLSKRELVEVFEKAGDRALLTNRLTGTPMADVMEINVMPEAYQFKQGVNEAGEQAGQSLANVSRWDPEGEGTIQVWRNPQTGTLDLVNGHNRLALAKRLGLNTVRVEYLDAFDIADARRQGAISNISTGGGTVWDAAKFIRDSPELNDLAALKASGKPGASGFWKQGLALSKLPDDMFKAAQDGMIDTKHAVMIGESGLDPEKIRKLYAFAANTNPSPSDGVMRARIELARQAPTGEADQGVLFGSTQVDLTDEKARLYDEVNRALVTDKNLFGRVSREASNLRNRTGTQVDVKGSIAVSEQAKAAQRYFQQVWATQGPVGDLLNNGALALNRGSTMASVVDEIKQKLPAILDMEMGKGGTVDTTITAPAERQMALGEEPEPDATPAGEPDPAVPDEVVQRWESWTPAQQDKMALNSKKKLLSQTQVANREAKAGELKARSDKAGEWLEDDTAVQQGRMTKEAYNAKWGTDYDTAKEPPVTQPKSSEWKPAEELEEHDWARNYLNWYEQRAQSPGLPEPDAEAMNLAIVQRALERGEARLPGLELPELAESSIDLEAVARELADGNPGRLTEEAFAEEARLREEQGMVDREVAVAGTDAERAATGWYEAPYEAKKADVVEGWEPQEIALTVKVEELPAKAPAAAAGQSTEGLSNLSVKELKARAKGLDIKGFSSWKKAQLVEVIEAKEASLASLADSAARIEKSGRAMAEIALRNDPRTPIANMFAREGATSAVKSLDWINQVRGAGLNEVAPEGAPAIAPPKPELPAVERAGNLQAQTPPADSMWKGPTDAFPTYDDWLDGLEGSLLTRFSKREESNLRIWQVTLLHQDLNRLARGMSHELIAGLKEAGRISGLDPEKIKILESIEPSAWADKPDIVAATRAHQPATAEWLDARWDTSAADSYRKTVFASGVQVGEKTPFRGGMSPYAGSVLIDLGKQVDRKVGSAALEASGRNGLWHVMYHEAFHVVQELLSVADQAALRTPKAVEEMKAIIVSKNGQRNILNSADTEIEAEAFAAWSSDMKQRGDGSRIVDRIFSRIELTANFLSKRLYDLLGWTPTVKQVFAAAYFGDYGTLRRKIAGATDSDIDTMVRNVNRHVNKGRPELVKMIEKELRDRVEAVEEQTRRFGEDWFTKDCT